MIGLNIAHAFYTQMQVFGCPDLAFRDQIILQMASGNEIMHGGPNIDHGADKQRVAQALRAIAVDQEV